MAKRLNPGRSSDLPILHDTIEYNNPDSSAVEFWTVYDRGFKDGFAKWKLAASAGTTVLGKANYSLNVKNGELWTSDDGSRLKAERPELFAIIAGLAAGHPAPSDTLTSGEEDPFGDLALARGGKLMQIQQWNRALLNMRVFELHWECRPDRDNLPPGVVRASSWEQGVRQSWFGIYRDNFERVIEAHKKSIAVDARLKGTFSVDTGKTTPNFNAAILQLTRHLTAAMPQDMLDDAIAFIKRRGEGAIDYDAYCLVMKKFHEGEYKPTSYQTLNAMLDAVSGAEANSVDIRTMEDLLS
jgi:hypothetical protein